MRRALLLASTLFFGSAFGVVLVSGCGPADRPSPESGECRPAPGIICGSTSPVGQNANAGASRNESANGGEVQGGPNGNDGGAADAGTINGAAGGTGNTTTGTGNANGTDVVLDPGFGTGGNFGGLFDGG